ncbi:hemerythrin domain-containing protein [uncultured Clostridium sp.]|uniref:hemerythrin domain-containing protein n=1 Tax=uncultured Clostridium sp. TaxID=59620 RepID=UPI00262190A7|nr:hemerythrin domain-containing protein [uncultured Clostridium sp.]
MDAIEFLKDEHRNVERILEVIKEMNYLVLTDSNKIDYNDFNIIIDCIRNYADKIHHKKEEDMLFKVMVEKLPEAIRKTIQYGMLVEHDQGRMFVASLEEAIKQYKDGDDRARLSIISNSMEYVHLLERHIDKEDRVVFNFAKNNLANLDKELLNIEFSKHINISEINMYLEKIIKLEKKYL